MVESEQSVSTFYVSTDGSDAWPGSRDRPFRSIPRARDAVRALPHPRLQTVRVLVRSGTYYLDAPLEFHALDSGTTDAPITYMAYPDEYVTMSGGRRLPCEWRPYRAGIMRCQVSDQSEDFSGFDRLFVNGRRQIRARFPNLDNSDPKSFTGYILAAGKIDDDVRDPHPGPNDDMVFSGGATTRNHFPPDTFTAKRWGRPARGSHPYLSGPLLGKPAMATKGCRLGEPSHLVWHGWDADGRQVGGHPPR